MSVFILFLEHNLDQSVFGERCNRCVLTINRVSNRYLLIRPLLRTPNVEIRQDTYSRTLLPVREIKAGASVILTQIPWHI